MVEGMLNLSEAHGITNVLTMALFVCFILLIAYLLKKNSSKDDAFIKQHVEFQETLVKLQERRITDIKEVIDKYYDLSVDVESSLQAVMACLSNISNHSFNPPSDKSMGKGSGGDV